ncbi:MAG: hypothetical protein A2908_03550 [Candidatus Staskawiczbacteria bacterium RIFCSPLOWO2_01_FULL_38_12b]|uniref:Multidrug ABC transporter substrate-binding protein n=1 Tax=Candidatus Staskawiczbacteria bacterium RIFCSPLOWO2_01_FULL_38_12b TaxID=1802214 RepID=A0A1G2ICW5_9BACT|nr:MAG: hypothetical protein A2908_03550 [Candidatus Staskawiczbacteria bacterium RIFCSPLOWO2_01_FULL_38_12b]
MIISDLFEQTTSALLVNKARSGLTILGIIIGIASVIAMVSIGQGAKGTIESSIQSLGSNLVTVTPGVQGGFGGGASVGRGTAQSLTLEDSETILKEISTVKAVSPELSGRYQITAKGTNTNTQVLGVSSSYPEVKNIQVELGSFISDQNVKTISKVAVLGPTTRDDLFGEGIDPTGQTIRIKGINFKVIGVTVAKGGSAFNNQDDMVFVPVSTAQKFLSGNSYISSIGVQAVDQNSMADMQTQITSLLLDRHHIFNPELADFSTLNQADILGAASSITNTFTILLAAIAGISLVVGGIGIMNMMLTTVTERTREIGLRKAIGAKRKDISNQFLAEAVLLTLIGGVLGICLGWVISFLVSKFGGIATSVSLYSIVLAFGVSAAIGIVFGYYPAHRAAKLNPIEALRYE